MSKKGSAFERAFSKMLSEWWSDGEHDDLFWRSAQSGGRATQRRKKGKRTTGHCGDICATDEQGAQLIKTICFELKCGYLKDSVHDILDKPTGTAGYLRFFQQAENAASNANAVSWIVVAQRTRRKSMVWMPESLSKALRRFNGPDYCEVPIARIRCPDGRYVVGAHTETFFSIVTPKNMNAVYHQGEILQ